MKFCRACGQDLSLVSQALRKSGPIMLLGQLSKELKENKELRRKPSIVRGTLWTGIGLLNSIVWFRIFYKYPSLLNWPSLLGIFMALFFLGLGVREFVKYKRSLALDEPGNREDPSADEPQFGSILGLQSITESTTQHLDVKNRETKRD